MNNLRAKLAGSDWKGLLENASDVLKSKPQSVAAMCYKGEALRGLGRHREALQCFEEALQLNSLSKWAALRKFESLLDLSEDELAISYIQNAVNAGEISTDSYVIRAVIDRLSFSPYQNVAMNLNQLRLSLVQNQSGVRKCIVIQVFNKPDTTYLLIDALSRCRGINEYNILIVQDSAIGSPKEDMHREQVNEVYRVIIREMQKLREACLTVSFAVPPRNLGTCGACQFGIQKAMEYNDYIVFIEDDVVLAPDAIEWFNFAYSKLSVSEDTLIACAESIFFNRKVEPDADAEAKIRAIAHEIQAERMYDYLSFAPSSCFASTSNKLKEFLGIRGLPRGDTALSYYMKENNFRCLMPVVPRGKDIGMHHERGYSVGTHGLAGVQNKKNTYFVSSETLAEAMVKMNISRSAFMSLTCHFDLSRKILDKVYSRHQANGGEEFGCDGHD